MQDGKGNFAAIPEEVITDNIISHLERKDILALQEVSKFFLFTTNSRKTLLNKLKSYGDQVFEHSNKLSLETIEDYLGFLIQHKHEYGLLNAAASLCSAIRATEETLNEIKRQSTILCYTPKNCTIEEAQNIEQGVIKDKRNNTQFQIARLAYLKDLLAKKFGFLGIVYFLIYTIDSNGRDKTKKRIDTLSLLLFIKFALAQGEQQEAIQLLNEENTRNYNDYVRNSIKPDPALTFGQSETLISIDKTSKDIHVMGMPIDTFINSISHNLQDNQIEGAKEIAHELMGAIINPEYKPKSFFSNCVIS